MAAVENRYPYDSDAAIVHLKKSDSVLGALIDRVGEFELDCELNLEPFEALLESIVYQQLSGRAAATIYGRLLALFPNRASPRAQDILNTPVETLRGCGLSAAKVRAVKDLASKTNDGELPELKEAEKMSNQQVIDIFTTVWGIGQWTAEMLLIFHLGRPDVLPATDLGVQRGFMRTYGLESMPAPADLLAQGEKWKPYRSVASWYLWRAADGGDKRQNRS